jgi:DnaK suppressor protein
MEKRGNTERGPTMAVTLDYKELEQRLLQERDGLSHDIRRLQEISEEIRSDRGGGEGGISNHLAEGATGTFLQEQNEALLGNLRHTLGLVESAIRRLDSGNYGLCEVCSQPIDPARLDTLPYAARCVSCQTRLEES